MVRLLRARCLALVGAVSAMLVSGAGARAADTYIALGDSLAYGYTNASTPTSYGDQGYVTIYADYLGIQHGGVRPRLINLGVVGETTATYFTGGSPDTHFNLNYSGLESQQSQFEAHVAAEHGAGNSVVTVSIQLGANDFDYIQDPAFLALPPDQQLAQIEATFAAIQVNYLAALTEIVTLAPEAQVLIMGYYDPYAALPAGNEVREIAAELFQTANSLLAGLATATGARFVDVYPAFVHRELAYTYIGAPPFGDNPHANPIGYAAMALTMIPTPHRGFVASLADWRAGQVDALDASLFTGGTAAARAARRAAMSHQFEAAHNEVAAHADLLAFLTMGEVVLETDGRPSPPDWMVASPQRTLINGQARNLGILIGLLR